MKLNIGAIVPLCDFKFSNAPDHCRASLQTVLLLAKGSTTFFGWKIVPRSLPLLPK